MHMFAMSHAQRAYRLEHDRFAPSYEALKLKRPSQTENFQYSMQVTPLVSFHRATPRHQKFKDFQKSKDHVSAVFAIGPKTATKTIICQAESDGMNPPPYPIISNGVVRCAAGTVRVRGSSMKPEISVGRDWEIAHRTLSYIANGEFKPAIELAETIKDPTYQLMTFLTLADKYVAMGNTEQAEKWRDRSFPIAEAIEVGSVSAENLVGFASQYAAMGKTDLKEQLLAKALATTKTLINDTEQADALVTIAPHLNKTEQQNTILYMASAFPSDWRKANVLKAIAPHLKTTQQYDTILQIVLTFPNESQKSEILMEIIPDLKTDRQFDRAAQIADTISDAQSKERVLKAIEQAR
jgi:tetratricopeptide (TPR) repeat protein